MPPGPARVHVPQGLVPAILVSSLGMPIRRLSVLTQHIPICSERWKYQSNSCCRSNLCMRAVALMPAKYSSRIWIAEERQDRERCEELTGRHLAAILGVHLARLLLRPAPIEAPAPGRLPQRVLILRQQVCAVP